MGVYKVSLQFQKFVTEANERTDKWKLLQNQTYIFKSFFLFFLPHLIHFYMGAISCTKHIKTVLDFCSLWVSIKSLYNFKNLLQRQMRGQMSGNYYKIRRIYLSFFPFFFSPHLIHFYMGAISCTKHIKTVLDFCSLWVSIKSLYNFKNLLQRQLTRYVRQVCSMYSVVIKIFVTLHFRYSVDE